MLVTRSTLVDRRKQRLLRPRQFGPDFGDQQCGESLSSKANSYVFHDEEHYREETGCVTLVDMLSPCFDKKKSIEFLLHPQWFKTLPKPSIGIPVQVITKDRPRLLFRTISKLVEQAIPQCITINIDGGKDGELSRSEQSTLRVAQWFSRVYGVHWRINPDFLHPHLARKLGFRRNYADSQHQSNAVSGDDRLVHIVWNSVVHGFYGNAIPTVCSRNATVVLEDDLLPAFDMMQYFQYGLEVMEQDPKVKVVSAWNDNSFNIREVLRCGVQRWEYFMGLGWLITRQKVFADEITLNGIPGHAIGWAELG
jgi:hypothetical protein